MASQTACCERRGKAQIAAGWGLPENGVVLASVNDYDKSGGLRFARDMHRMGFKLYATPGTAAFIRKNSLPVESVNKMADSSPHTVDLIRGGEVQLVLNTPLGPHAHADGAEICAAAITMDIPLADHAFRGGSGCSGHPGLVAQGAEVSQFAGTF